MITYILLFSLSIFFAPIVHGSEYCITDEEIQKLAPITMDDFFKDATYDGKEDKNTNLYTKRGGGTRKDALKNFYALQPTNVKEMPGYLTGRLPDGKTIILRFNDTHTKWPDKKEKSVCEKITSFIAKKKLGRRFFTVILMLLVQFFIFLVLRSI